MSLAALRDAHKPALQKTALALGGGVGAAAIGYGASHSWQALAMATGAIASLGLSLAGSWLLPIAAIPAAFVDARLPLGSGSLSAADLAVVLGAAGAAVHLDWRSNRRLIPVLVALVLYEVTLGLGVVGNPGLAAALELAHRATIVGGSLVISSHLDECIQQIKSTSKIPILLFPGSPSQVSCSWPQLHAARRIVIVHPGTRRRVKGICFL